MFFFDLKSGYHHVDIFPDHRKYLSFSWTFSCGRTRFFEFTVLAFGLSPAPYLFTRFLKPLVRKWRSEATVVYLDDALGSAAGYNNAKIAILEVHADLCRSGFLRTNPIAELFSRVNQHQSAQRSTSSVCFAFGKPGHWSACCPSLQRFNSVQSSKRLSDVVSDDVWDPQFLVTNCIWEPTQVISWLGSVINTATSRIAATDEQIMSLQYVLNSILSVSSVRIPVRKLASVCEKVILLTNCVGNISHPTTRNFFWWSTLRRLGILTFTFLLRVWPNWMSGDLT